MLLLLLVVVLLLPGSLEGLRQLYLAGTFPINGSDGWQGGQVSPANQSECRADKTTPTNQNTESTKRRPIGMRFVLHS